MGYIRRSSGSGINIGDWDMGNINWEDNVNHYQEMIFDAARPEFGMCSQSKGLKVLYSVSSSERAFIGRVCTFGVVFDSKDVEY